MSTDFQNPRAEARGAVNDPVFISIRPGIEASVCIEIARRQEMGIAKYGTTVADNPLALRAWLEHQYTELLDAAIYCKRAIAEIDAQDERDLDDMCCAGRLPKSIGTCGNVGEGEA